MIGKSAKIAIKNNKVCLHSITSIIPFSLDSELQHHFSTEFSYINKNSQHTWYIARTTNQYQSVDIEIQWPN